MKRGSGPGDEYIWEMRVNLILGSSAHTLCFPLQTIWGGVTSCDVHKKFSVQLQRGGRGGGGSGVQLEKGGRGGAGVGAMS